MIKYRVEDWLSVAPQYIDDAAVVFLDANWAAPARHAALGVDYVTHPISEDAESDFPDSELEHDTVDCSRYITEFIDAAWDALKPGGWLILDSDSYSAPRFENYIRNVYGEVRTHDENGRPYQGGGLRKRGAVIYRGKDGSPDCSGCGQYGAEGGFPVIFAHKGETDRTWSKSVRQFARRPRWVEPTDEYDQGTIKPVDPYEVWLDAIVEPGELILSPCAGSGPALIAAERLWGDDANAVGFDINDSSKKAWERRRNEVLASLGGQDKTLAAYGADT